MENYIEEDKVYVLDKNEVLIAVFDKEDEQTIINPRIEERQNAEAMFTFSISSDNPKWSQINNPENLYVVDGKVFSTNFEGCFVENINENNENLIDVKAYERQKLLSRKYVRAWNSETGFEKIDIFMVVILANGNLSLKNNGTVITSSHAKGTSGYALDALLYGTGWTTGTCDVEGTFDLETDQVDIYENILKIQEIWGGILVFDSVNKIVHHRDETKFLPYNGYEVKYEKNMQSLEKLYNNKIITKLCPLGESGLNIKSVNNGSEWITNYSYTDSVLEGIENNPDIYDSEQLLRWGQRKLQDLCKPRKELTVDAVLLYQVEGYELEKVELNDIVDIINYGDIYNNNEQLRVVGYSHRLWDFSDAVLELSDVTLDSTDIFKKNVSTTNSINDGNLNANKIVSFFTGNSVNKDLSLKVGNGEIISRINQSPEEIQIAANKLSLEGKEIDLTTDNIEITSDNFSVDAEGNMECNNAKINGTLYDSNGDVLFDDDKLYISSSNVSTTGFLSSFFEGTGNLSKAYLTFGQDWGNINPSGLGHLLQGISAIATKTAIDILITNGFLANEGIKFSNNTLGASIWVSHSLDSTETYPGTYITADGITTPTVTQTSKEESKKNFKKLQNALDIIKNIDIYKYNMKTEEDGTKKHIGFIIGDKYKYSEEITSKNNDGVDIYSFVSVCCQAIKEQQKQIEELKQQIQELKDK